MTDWSRVGAVAIFNRFQFCGVPMFNSFPPRVGFGSQSPLFSTGSREGVGFYSQLAPDLRGLKLRLTPAWGLLHFLISARSGVVSAASVVGSFHHGTDSVFLSATRCAMVPRPRGDPVDRCVPAPRWLKLFSATVWFGPYSSLASRERRAWAAERQIGARRARELLGLSVCSA